VLGSTVQRPVSATYSSRQGSALRRRLVVGILVVLSLAMITVYFRAPDSGPVHDLQDGAAQVVRPFQIAADRVASPFQDAYGYFDGLFAAKSENARLREELDRLRVLATQNQTAADENQRLKALLDFRDSPAFPRDFAYVAARVTATAPTAFQQQIAIAAGTSDGVGLDDPVVTRDGLVGRVTRVTSRTAQVTLLTDRASAVSAMDLTTNASGLIRHGQGRAETLFLDRVAKTEVVDKGDVVVTAGTQPGELPSLYPKGIQIGEVVSVDQSDTESYKQIQVKPFVDFSSLDAVLVLVSEKAAAGR
jgi:rod shape-determining protein MreC